MKHHLHPDVKLQATPDSGVVLSRPDGSEEDLVGAEALILLDIAAGRDARQEALSRWEAPADLINAGVDKLIESLRSRGLLREEIPAAAANPFTVLFVCTANICRSAYAAAYARGRAVGGVHFASAGTHALVGQPMDPPMASHLIAAGLDADHTARQLTRRIASDADLIITLTGSHRDYILDEWPELAHRTFVIGQATRELQALPDDIARDDITGHLWRHRSHDPRDSVIDPYGQGDDAAARTAREIEEHVDAILAALGRVLP